MLVQGQHLTTATFGTFDHQRIGQTQWQVGVTAHQRFNSSPIGFMIQFERRVFDVAQEGQQDGLTKPLLEQVGDFGQDSGWDEIRWADRKPCRPNPLMVLILGIQQREHGTGVKRDHFQFSRSQVSLSAPFRLLSPAPMEAKTGMGSSSLSFASSACHSALVSVSTTSSSPFVPTIIFGSRSRMLMGSV